MTMLAHAHGELSILAAWFTDGAPTVAVSVFVLWYTIGVRHAWEAAGAGRGITRRQVGWFAAAVALLVLALLSPLDALGGVLFAAHMTQHLLLAVVLPPVVLLAAPELALFWALPRSRRQWLAHAFHGRDRLRACWRTITLPFVACAVHAVATWLWHAPRLYELALGNDAVHLLEHASFLGSGMLLWWFILHPSTDRRSAYGSGILALFITAMQTGVLGALITLSHHTLYPAQAAGAAAWGLTPLEDQQLAGLLMWVVGGLLYVVAMSVLFLLWLSPPARGRARRAVVAASVVGAACRGGESRSVRGGDSERGQALIAAIGCGACHVIPGMRQAHGKVGPPLGGIANRAIIGGILPNTPENMMRWIQNPPAIAPETAMPNLGITPEAARDITAYLYTLQ